MKQYSIEVNRIVLSLSIAALSMSCSKNSDVQDTRLYSGKDISAYASISADNKSKESTMEIVKDGAWALYQGEYTGDFNFDKPLVKGSAVGKSHLSTHFQLYCLEWNDGSRALLGLRQLPLEGQANFRDLGGYKTADGRYVKRGVVFRSGRCSAITEADRMYLASIPLKTVIDFRSDPERPTEPNLLPSTVVRQKVIAIEPGEFKAVDIANKVLAGDTATLRQFVLKANIAYVNNFQNEYKAFFAELMDPSNSPLMFHCTIGKDRTGFGAAMFLAALGVDRETIIQDYLLTNALTHFSLDEMKALYGDNNVATCFYYLYYAKRESIEAAFTSIETQYGSVNNFLTKQLGVDLNKIRELYLY